MKKFFVKRPRRCYSEDNLTTGDYHLRDNDKPISIALEEGRLPTFIVQTQQKERGTNHCRQAESEEMKRRKGFGVASCPAMIVTSPRSLRNRRPASENGDADQTTRRHVRGGSLRQRLTFSSSDKRMSLRQKTELSTEESAPGVLKIFGHSISPGSDYKSVLATPRSTAVELVKEALQRYGIPKEKHQEFALCDVIGNIVQYESESDADEAARLGRGVWSEECIRVISANERPLILQSFWKPNNGFSRRFELRKKADVINISEKDTTTSGINANARRLLMTKTDKGAIPGVQDLAFQSSNAVNEPQVNGVARFHPTSDSRSEPLMQHKAQGINQLSSEYSGTAKRIGENPLLLVISGADRLKDEIYYELQKDTTYVGSDPKYLQQDDLVLTALDVKNRHCIFNKSMINSEYVNTARMWSTSVTPFPQCKVRVNHDIIISETVLMPGDLISIGDHYVLLLKDPSGPFQRETSDITQNLSALPLRINREEVQLGESATSSPTSSHRNVPSPIHSPKERESKYLKIPFIANTEDELIETILKMVDCGSTDHPIVPSYLLCGVVEYGLCKYGTDKVEELLEKIGVAIQNKVWEKAMGLADKHNIGPGQPSLVDEILPDLRPLLVWMSNSMELLHHMVSRSREEEAASQPALQADVTQFTLVMEEVVMYTFQQTVYYLTKTLYHQLSALLENNPFHEDGDYAVPSSNHRRAPPMASLVRVFTAAHQEAKAALLHDHMFSSLFSYLFFFVNTSVMNRLMSKGAGVQYYKWTKGAQMRGNLDKLEAWANQNGLSDEAMEHLTKLSCLVDLLATPKPQLLQASWETLQRDFPSLSEAQLQKVLAEYHLGHGKQRPEHWSPPRSIPGSVTEDLRKHPALSIPKSGFYLDMTKEITSPSVHETIAMLTARFGPKDDDGDSGLSMSQHMNLDIHGQLMYTGQLSDNASSPRDKEGRQSDIVRNAGIMESTSPKRRSSRNLSYHCAIKSETPARNLRYQSSQCGHNSPSQSQCPSSYHFEKEKRNNSSQESKSYLTSVDSSETVLYPYDKCRKLEYYNENANVNMSNSMQGLAIDSNGGSDTEMCLVQSVHNSCTTLNELSCASEEEIDIPRDKKLDEKVAAYLGIQHLNIVGEGDPDVGSADEMENDHQSCSSEVPTRHFLGSNKERAHQRQDDQCSIQSLPVSLTTKSFQNFTVGCIAHERKSTSSTGFMNTSSHSLDTEYKPRIKMGTLERKTFISQDSSKTCGEDLVSSNKSLQTTARHGKYCWNIPSEKLGIMKKANCPSSAPGYHTEYKSHNITTSRSASGVYAVPSSDHEESSTVTVGRRPSTVPPLDLSKLSSSMSEYEEDKVIDVTSDWNHGRVRHDSSLRVLPLSTSNIHQSNVGIFPDGEEDRESCAPSSARSSLVRTISGSVASDDEEQEEEPIRMVRLKTGARPLGISLVDGMTTPLNRPGIFILDVVENSVAAAACLATGDCIVAINGRSLTGTPVSMARRILETTKNDVVLLVSKGDLPTAFSVTASYC